jgi:hypothetical protein
VAFGEICIITIVSVLIEATKTQICKYPRDYATRESSDLNLYALNYNPVSGETIQHFI